MEQPSEVSPRIQRPVNGNAGLWALGNGLLSTQLISYFAQSLGAGTGAIALIIAAPKLVGGLRWLSPYFVSWGLSQREVSLGAFALSISILLWLPFCAWQGLWPSAAWAVSALVVCWCLYHLAEYCGYVALAGWMLQLVPEQVRGRFFGQREVWLTAGRLAGYLIAAAVGKLLWHFTQWEVRWLTYPLLAIAGATAMGFSLLPLVRLPLPSATELHSGLSFQEQWKFWSTGRAGMFLLYGTWFSAANGLFSTLLYIYPYRGLGLSLFLPLLLPAIMFAGQSLISRPAGKAVDQIGWPRVIICGQLLVSLGPAMFVLGTVGYVMGNLVWIAYALINIALPIAIVDGREGKNPMPPLAFYFGWTGIVYGLTTLAGKPLANWFVSPEFQFDPTSYNLYFYAATTARMTTIFPLCWILWRRPSGDSKPTELRTG